MSDSDDDLLELAGIGSDEESDYEPKTSAGRRGTKRTINEDEDEDDEDIDNDIEELNPEEDPYPLEGKYKDEADKARLMQMDEVSREGILYDRIQEKDKFRERRFLALRAKQSKAESKTIQKGSTSKKLRTSKLSELKRQRERKSNKENRRKRGEDYEEEDYEEDYRDEDDDDADLKELAGYGDEDDEYYSDDYNASKKSSRQKSSFDQSLYQDASLDDINNKIRSSRSILEKYLYRDEFDTCIPGTLVRINIGPSPNTNKPQYRMALVEEVRRGGKPYKLSGKLCNTYLKVSQGDSAKIFELAFLSNSLFTPEDYKIYKDAVLSSTNHTLPTVGYVQDKFSQLREMATRTLTDADINKMMAKKEELSVYEMNTAARVRKLGRLREELQVALEQGDEELANSLQKEIDQLSKFFKGHQNTSKLEQINIRNQKSNQEFIRKAEKKIVETKRKQLQNNDFSDPFSRLRTNPKVFYKSAVIEDENTQENKEKEDNKVEEKNKIKNSIFRREGIDALIKDIDIDIDFNL